ncbi:pulmonary surfactant-associated protein D-like [Branchiostoma floridae]|uniref:Pulmonary surfactant-associated protein D-like n=1 Tax=Branchiostoma floridae TaxID=7739 RepID=A0A9J7LX59_BRAFL|nr:pulmonary surfactant-associated protein D-like [Branchiostoma floridae]
MATALLTNRTYPDGARRRTLCSFIRSHRSCITAGIAVLIAVGLAPLTFINKERDRDDFHQLSTTVDALKRDLDSERSRVTALEQRLQEMRYTEFRGICYKAFNTKKTFSGAAAACGEDGGTLAMPKDAETDAFLVSLRKSVSDSGLFCTVMYEQAEPVQSPLSRPDSGQTSGPPPQPPGPPVHQGGSLGRVRHGNGPSDKLKEDQEASSHTYEEAEVVKGHATCTSAAFCPKGYTAWNGICYKAFNTGKTFSDAAAACGEDGGTLAMPRDAETNTFLISLHNAVSEKWGFWFGLHDRREEGSFEWMDGSALGTYSSWGPGEPNNGRGEQHCVGYSAVPHWKDKWVDISCDWQFCYICQTVPGRP